MPKTQLERLESHQKHLDKLESLYAERGTRALLARSNPRYLYWLGDSRTLPKVSE